MKGLVYKCTACDIDQFLQVKYMDNILVNNSEKLLCCPKCQEYDRFIIKIDDLEKYKGGFEK